MRTVAVCDDVDTEIFGIYSNNMLVAICVGRKAANEWIHESGDSHVDLVVRQHASTVLVD